MQKTSLFIVLLIVFVNYLGFGLVYSLFVPLLFDPSQNFVSPETTDTARGAILGLLIALTPLTQFFSAPIFGAFSDVKGRKPALMIGTWIGCVGYALAVVGIWMNSLVLLCLYRILVGLADATGAVAQATIADISDETNKARRFALFTSSLGLGFTIGPLAGGLLADPFIVSWFNYTTPFIAGGLMCLLNFVLVYFLFPETQKLTQNRSYSLSKGLLQFGRNILNKDLRWLFLAGFILCFGWAIYNQFIPVLLMARFGFDQSNVSNFYAYSSAWYAFNTGLGTMPLLKRYPPGKLIAPALIGAALCITTFLLIEEPHLLWWILPVLLYLLALVFPSVMTLVSNSSESHRQGEFLGTYQSIQCGAFGLSPLIMGSIVGTYPFMASLASSALLIIACIILSVAYRKLESEHLVEAQDNQ